MSVATWGKQTASTMGERFGATLVGRLVARYQEDGCANLASMVAFNLMFALFPMLLAVAGLAGLVVGSSTVRGGLRDVIHQAIPPQAQPSLDQILLSLNQRAGLLGTVSLLGLVWGGSALFGSIETALDRVFRVPGRSFLRQKLMSVTMMLAFTTVMIVSLGASTVLVALATAPLEAIPDWLRVSALTTVIGQVAGALAATVLFSLVLWWVPNRRMRVRWVLPGAALAGIGFQLLTLLFPFYWQLTSGGSRYGSAIGLAFLLLTWLYLSSQLLLLGAELTALRSPAVMPAHPPADKAPPAG